MRLSGTGTQKLEEAVKEHFPDKGVVRLDRDAVSRKGAGGRLVNDFADGMTDMTFSLATDQIALAQAALEGAKDEIGYQEIIVDDEVAKVSIVGIGMRSHAGVAQKMFSALAADGINIKVITTSEIKVSVLIDRRYMELAVQSLHKAFEMEAA